MGTGAQEIVSHNHNTLNEMGLRSLRKKIKIVEEALPGLGDAIMKCRPYSCISVFLICCGSAPAAATIYPQWVES